LTDVAHALRPSLADDRLSVLLEASEVLGTSMDAATTLRDFARCLVPRLADVCSIETLDDTGVSAPVVFAHADPEKTAALRDLRRSHPPDPSANAGVAAVLRTGRSELHRDITSETSVAGSTDIELEIWRALAPCSAMIVAMRARGRTVGAMTLLSTRPDRRFDELDLRLAEQLAQRAALAVDNSSLYEAEQSARKRAELAAQRISRLQGFTSALAKAITPEEVADVMVDEGLLALGATGALFVALEGDGTLGIPARAGEMPDLAPPGETPLSRLDGGLVHRAMSTSDELMIEMTGEDLLSVAKVGFEGRTFGLFFVAYADRKQLDEADRAFSLTLVRQSAQALERGLLYESERWSNERLRLLSGVSEALASTLDEGIGLASVARLLTPALGEACMFDVIEGDQLRRRAFPAAHAETESVVEEIVARPGPDHPISRALLEGEPHVAADVSAASLGPLPLPPALAGAETVSLLTVPLGSRTGVIGAMTLFASSGRTYGPGERSLAQDLAHRVAMSLENARLYRDAQEANRAKDEFLSIASHELRTPLTAVLGWTQMLSTRQDDPVMVGRGLAVIERNARAQVKIIEDILDVSRIIAGKLRLDVSWVGVESVVRAAIDVVRPVAEGGDVDLALLVEGDPGKVRGDPDRLQQIVWNLVTNAVKFTPRGGRVEVTLSRDGDRVVLRVSDTGNGIAPDFLPFVFDHFRQADSSPSRSHGGLGLGLAIVRHLAQMHGGTVQAESPGIGRGATFTVTLPAPGPESRETPISSKPGGVPAPPPRDERGIAGMRVLVVEDDEDAREMLRTILAREGASVETAGSAQEAVEVARRFTPEVLLSDIGMPHEDGYSLVRRLRAENGDFRAVALTAYARREDARRAKQAGFEVHVPKPVEPSVLLSVLAGLQRAR
jgi:signal transduction histidine kinase